MAWASNYTDVLSQLTSAGLLIDNNGLTIGKMARCKLEGEGHEKRGWYSLHEVVTGKGETILVGAFGIWFGAENNAQKIEISKEREESLSPEQLESIKRQRAEARKQQQAEERARHEKLQQKAAAIWRSLPTEGESAYLQKKQVQSFGLRHTTPPEDIVKTLNPDYDWPLLAPGGLVIPRTDAAGKVHGLQIILTDPGAIERNNGINKRFWPIGQTQSGQFHLIGSPPAAGGILLLAEGYASAASPHMATGYPAACAFDAGNLPKVARALKARYPTAKILVLADDDHYAKCPKCKVLGEVDKAKCQEEGCDGAYTHGNTGLMAASNAAMDCGGAWLAPSFAQRDKKNTTDFNDLHVREGLQAVREQIEFKLSELGWISQDRYAITRSGPPHSGGSSPGGEGEAGIGIQGCLSVDEANDRYTLVYDGDGVMFDHHLSILVKKSSVMDVLEDHGWREWKRLPNRKLCLLEDVGFDPAENDSRIKCNLWTGWPTKPKAGSCEKWLDLLMHLCAGEEKSAEVAAWVMRWLAYPIQNPGAKMHTSLVFHGPQGVGKDMAFGWVKEIYGKYGILLDQSAVEDKHNDWASRRLFIIANEVVAREELYHVKNRLKNYITGETLRINPKHLAAHDEANHMNFVFLSNETIPLVLEADDRRYTVIWTPEKMPADIYTAVAEEKEAGGVAALHEYLLAVNLADFSPWTPPPDTKAKRELVETSLDSTSRFWKHMTEGSILEIKPGPCLSTDLYKLYQAWCPRVGIKNAAPEHIFSNKIGKLPSALKKVDRFRTDEFDRTTGEYKVKQATFFYPDKNRAEPPDNILMDMDINKRRRVWLGDCAKAFSDALSAYRAGKPGEGGQS